jgi:hypothetical protein
MGASPKERGGPREALVFEKQSRQKTGRPGVGVKGTEVGLLHLVQTTSVRVEWPGVWAVRVMGVNSV